MPTRNAPAHLPATTPRGCSTSSLFVFFILYSVISSLLFPLFVSTPLFLAFSQRVFSLSVTDRSFVRSPLLVLFRIFFFLILFHLLLLLHNNFYLRLYRLTRHPLFRVQRTVQLAGCFIQHCEKASMGAGECRYRKPGGRRDDGILRRQLSY